jgi:hypothetical protein
MGTNLIIFPLFLMGKIRIHPVWYKSKDLERIKDVYRGTTVLNFKTVGVVLDDPILLSRTCTSSLFRVSSLYCLYYNI